MRLADIPAVASHKEVNGDERLRCLVETAMDEEPPPARAIAIGAKEHLIVEIPMTPGHWLGLTH